MTASVPTVSSNNPLKVVILGCGRVGSTLARQLSREGHTVTVIDVTSDAFRRLGPKFKGQRKVGTGLDQDTLESSGLREANVFIAVTQGDNTNIMAAQLAKEVFSVPRVIARIYDPIRAQAYRQMGITTLCTTTLAAGLIRATAIGEEDQLGWQETIESWDNAYLEQIK